MKKKVFLIDGKSLTAENSIDIVENNIEIKLSRNSLNKIRASRKLVEKWISKKEIVYGINTGFGEFKDVIISPEDTERLQRNLILSHSAGIGNYIPDVIVRLMILFRINSLAKGYSGVRPELVEFLIKVFNNKIIPLVPSQGSVGSSGDLAPLSHMALTFIGEGKCKYKGIIYESKTALSKCGLKPIKLSSKEGLALTNGTQMMSAYLCKAIYDADYLSKISDIGASVSVEASRGTSKAFSENLQKVRPHKGQAATARNLRKLLAGSGIMKSHKECDKVQDAYSIRCIPQVHGPVKETIEYCRNILEIEINSATDNPLIFPETGEHIEGGNFHGEPLALISDYLGIAVSELGSISERRIARLVDGSLSGLPRFLTKKGGLNSGFMIAQYTAASLASENKVLAHPASVDSIPTSANQEDHNSMGSIASRKCLNIVNNVKKIIAIEFLCALQGITLLRPLKAGKGVEQAYRLIRLNVKSLDEDRIISEDIQKVMAVIYNKEFLKSIEKISGKLG